MSFNPNGYSFTFSHKTFTDKKNSAEKLIKTWLSMLTEQQREDLDCWIMEINEVIEDKLEEEEEEKMDLGKANVPLSSFSVPSEYAYNLFSPKMGSLVPLSYGTVPTYSDQCLEGCKKEKEKKMYNLDINCDCNSAPANPELVAKNYLVNRLFNAKDIKYSAAYEAFGLTTDTRPTTPKDLVERITSGKFVIKTDMEICKTHYPMDYIEWRDPAIKKDRPGFEAWEKLLNTAHLAAKDQIMIGTPADGLKALQAFEASTIQ